MDKMVQGNLSNQLLLCYNYREDDPARASSEAYRLFNGYYEGLPGLVIDRYAKTILISNHSRQPESLATQIDQVVQISISELKWIESILLKTRHSKDLEERKGRLLFGQNLPQEFTEDGVRYAIDLRLNQDDSFYLDTRNLRSWLQQNSKGLRVLNFFAYTGSLGVAALAGAAAEVLQTDSNSGFLAVAERSRQLNDLPETMRLWKSDYFKAIASLKKNKALFDIVILDAPFFSESRHGKVDLQKEQVKLVNKARPLVAHGGKLILINNALYVSGKQVISEISELGRSGHISLEQTVDIPQDVTGYPTTIRNQPPADPAPFNHPTKISILRVTRKDQAR
ncbi:MAG: SAM-dependent methyltransferase [Chloroflexi bacterium]|nr:SAM-dependent methyltransferase [Chloroflexota bacterium]